MRYQGEKLTGIWYDCDEKAVTISCACNREHPDYMEINLATCNQEEWQDFVWHYCWNDCAEESEFWDKNSTDDEDWLINQLTEQKYKALCDNPNKPAGPYLGY